MEHSCSKYHGRGETILKPVTKITNHIDGLLGKMSLKRF